MLNLQLVGQSMSQLFRKEVRIADLPRLQVPKRTKPARLDDDVNDVGLCKLFQTENNV